MENIMKEFFEYFFGQGTEVEFVNFTFAHILPILLTAGMLFLMWKFRDKIREYKHEEKIRYALAFIMIISEMSYYWRLIGVPSLNPNPVDHLPITVCGWVTVFGSYMIIGKSQFLFDLCYFWALSGTVFALITPTVITFTGPTRFRYYQFWVEHLVGYIAVFYMIFVHKLRPTVKSAVRAYVSLVILATVAFFANRIIGPGANYLFMAKPEDTPSILDILPSNFIIRLLIMAGAVTLLFFIAYLPWMIKDIREKKRSALSE